MAFDGNKILIVLGFILCVLLLTNGNKSLKLVAEWKELEFKFPSNIDRNNALRSGEYIPRNSVPIDVEVDYRGQRTTRVFVTIPRFTTGIPITLGTISTDMAQGGPVIYPYPSYSWHSNQGRNCEGITSVFRIAIDECQRLWVLDSGSIGDNQACPTQLLIFNLNNDQLIHRYKFPASQVRQGTSLFITPIVDVSDPPPTGTCVQTMVYIADVTGFSIIVYNLEVNRSWRTHNKLMFPHPHFGTFNLAGDTFDLMDGVFSMSLTPRNNLNHRTTSKERLLYFHALASITENAVPLRILNNVTAWENNPEYLPRSFIEIGSRGAQATAEAMDRNGNLFFGLINPIGVGCWDSSKSYNRDFIKVVTENPKTLQFVSGLKVSLNQQAKDELWVLSCRFQRVMAGTLDSTEINFRIQALGIDELLSGSSKCITRPEDNSIISFRLK